MVNWKSISAVVYSFLLLTLNTISSNFSDLFPLNWKTLWKNIHYFVLICLFNSFICLGCDLLVWPGQVAEKPALALCLPFSSLTRPLWGWQVAQEGAWLLGVGHIRGPSWWRFSCADGHWAGQNELANLAQIVLFYLDFYRVSFVYLSEHCTGISNTIY